MICMFKAIHYCQLADAFENFRSTCLEVYELDPAHFISAPGLAWEAALKKTKVNTAGTRRSGDVP